KERIATSLAKTSQCTKRASVQTGFFPSSLVRTAILIRYETAVLRRAAPGRRRRNDLGRDREEHAGATAEGARSVRGSARRAAAAAGEAAARHGHHQRFSGDDFVRGSAGVSPAGHFAAPLVLVH